MALSFLHPFAGPAGDFISLGAGPQSIATDGLVDHARWAGAKRAVCTHDNQHHDHHHDQHHDHHDDRLRARILERGVITRAIADHSLTFCPPLITTDRPVDQIIDTPAVAASE